MWLTAGVWGVGRLFSPTGVSFPEH